MKTGKTLMELVTEIDRQKAARKDIVADTRQLRVVVTGEKESLVPRGAKSARGEKPQTVPVVALEVADEGIYPLTPHAHRQLSSRLKIPAAYYDRCRVEGNTGLLAENANHWLHREHERRLVRTLDGNARAVLSDRYQPLDNDQFAEALLPAISAVPEASIDSCEITANRLYIKVTLPESSMRAEIPPPGVTDWKWGSDHHAIDVVTPGCVFSNSEIGAGALSVQPAVHTVQCSNLATFKSDAMRKMHLGGALTGGDAGGDVWEFLQDDTRRASQEALWLQVRDMAKAALDGTAFDAIVARLRKAREEVLPGTASPIKAMEVLVRETAISERDGDGILQHLISGGDLSRYGFSSAVTRHSQDVADYDKATELEEIGGSLVSLAPSTWAAMAKAAV